ncbi:MAG: CTP-dependent riboflavin kinase [Thaumarchaeota archaeon]|nr:CTP-dependent riboflavin kinase [Nitrososphaerota archaeon]
MTELKIQHLVTLTELLSKGAKNNYVSITTSTLGKNIHKSQQAASKHLLELEQGGFIERIMSGRKISVKLTKKGFDQISDLHNLIKNSLESVSSTIDLSGSLIAGMGEGKYYMSLKGYTKQFKTKIGYVPFPGTLNVKLGTKEDVESVRQLNNLDGIKIDGFSDGKRTYGWVKCFSCKVNGKVDSHLIMLERTHHDNSIVELISKFDIRKKLDLKNGSAVSIKILV